VGVELGHFALIVALLLAVAQAGFGLVGAAEVQTRAVIGLQRLKLGRKPGIRQVEGQDLCPGIEESATPDWSQTTERASDDRNTPMQVEKGHAASP